MSEYLNDGGECVGEGGPDDGVLGGANEELPWFPLGQSPHWAQRLPHLDRQTDSLETSQYASLFLQLDVLKKDLQPSIISEDSVSIRNGPDCSPPPPHLHLRLLGVVVVPQHHPAVLPPPRHHGAVLQHQQGEDPALVGPRHRLADAAPTCQSTEQPIRTLERDGTQLPWDVDIIRLMW